jgi:SAM-dependent methyltransferase
MDETRRRRALDELRPHIERARQFSGWEFGALRVRPLAPEPPWDYEAIARERAAQAERALDMGTGGGEVLSRIAADLPVRFVATEQWQINAPIARARLAPLGIDLVRCDSLRLPFRDATFDLVLSRHEALDPAEVVRVLRPGGRVVTQQVSRKQLYELRRFFPRMTDFGDHYGTYTRAFEGARLTVHAREHDWKVAYATLGDLVFLLMVTPWSIPGFDPEREIDTLLAVEDAYGSEEGIVLTEHRYLITAEDDR